MAQIQVLDSGTIDKIAAGEVVERPLSVVKELVENALDAGATSITVEIKDGGIELIRVTDNGSGIEASQVRNAFLRHATSKIRSAEDLSRIASLGFRGEALSSIAAVSKVEVITKTRDKLTGIHLMLEGASERVFEEVGAPDGTTIIMRNLFFNTPVRRKFLKQPVTEGSYIAELMEHMAMSRPDVSFKVMIGNQVRFHTSGNGDLKEVLYRIYGRDVCANLTEVSCADNGMEIQGYLGKPVLNRSNRNFETYFINGRYIKSTLIARAIEEGYKEYLMQHKFPFTALHIRISPEMVDVNVHPTKMDVRFTNSQQFYQFIVNAVSGALKQKEMIPEAVLTESSHGRSYQEVDRIGIEAKKEVTPEPFENKRNDQYRVMEEMKYEADRANARDRITSPIWNKVLGKEAVESEEKPFNSDRPVGAVSGDAEDDFFIEADSQPVEQSENVTKQSFAPAGQTQSTVSPPETVPSVQLNLFEEKLLSADNREEYRILGQIFDTYWLVAFRDKLFIVDQHAAHEKVKYETLIKQYREKSVASQSLNPPIVVTLTAKEELVLKEYADVFAGLGFEIEEFGGNEYALRSVPVDLYGCQEKEMFEEVLDELAEGPVSGNLTVVEEKIASMSCKAAVKGNHNMTVREMEALIDQLLTLDNPYNCPHGRPTIISMTKYEIEKKFKRIV